jgi:hypothetical protein
VSDPLETARRCRRNQLVRSIVALFLLTGVSRAEPRRARSGPERVSVLELFTSEGCSSCPPADELVNALPEARAGRVLPLAFHVDYWDDIGWADPFASPRWTARQRSRSTRLYTPALWLNGREVSGRALVAPRGVPGAELALELDGASVTVRARGGRRLFLALTESNLVVHVTAGENSGRTLRHDHVVRALYGPFSAERPTSQPLELDPRWARSALRLVAFVEDADGAVLNALAMPLEGPSTPPP